MKKIIAVFLLMTTVLNCFISMPTYAQGALAVDANIVEFLRTLNIVDKSYFENPDEIMSKGELIKLVVDFMDEEALADEYSGLIQFFDIDIADDYYKDVCYAASKGYCHGNGDGLIHAYDDATLFQGIVMFINAMGLREFAMGMGFEQGYIKIARNTGISDGLTSVMYHPLTKGTAIKLIYNILMSNVYDMKYVYTTDENIGTGYELKDTTYLYERFKMKEVEGIITATPLAYIENKLTETGHIAIDLVSYSNPQSYGEEMIGQKVVAYVKENEYGNDEIKYLCSADRTNVFVAFSNELTPYDEQERSYEYYDREKERSYGLKLTSSTEFIHNGTPIDGISAELLNPKDGRLTFIDNNNDNKYDYVIIESYKTMFVESVNTDTKSIFDSVTNFSLNYGKYDDRVFVINGNGSKRTTEEIAKDCILTVAEGKDVLKIYISENIIFDIIQKKSTSSKGTYFIMSDDIGYKANEYFTLNCAHKQKIGQNGNFYLDVFGRITYVKESLYNNMGYVIGLSISDGLSPDIKLKILNIYGEIEILDISNKVKVDNIKCDSGDDIKLQLSAVFRNSNGDIIGSGLKNNLIIYEVNSENLVTSIETAYDFNNISGELEKELGEQKIVSKYDGFHRSYQVDNLTYNGLRSFDGKGIMKPDIKVFVIPVDSKGEIAVNNTEAFDVLDVNYFSKWSTYTADQYKVNRESEGADAVVVFENIENNNMPGSMNVMCVSSIADTLSEDGEEVREFTGYVLSNEVTYYTRAEDIGEDVEIGDMMKFILDSQKRIKAAEKIYDSGSEQMLSETGSFANSFRVLIRPVYKINGNTVTIAEKSELSEIVNENDYESFFIDASIPVYKWDKDKFEVIPADISSILTYKQNPAEYSSLFLHMVSGNIRMAVIY